MLIDKHFTCAQSRVNCLGKPFLGIAQKIGLCTHEHTSCGWMWDADWAGGQLVHGCYSGHYIRRAAREGVLNNRSVREKVTNRLWIFKVSNHHNANNGPAAAAAQCDRRLFRASGEL